MTLRSRGLTVDGLCSDVCCTPGLHTPAIQPTFGSDTSTWMDGLCPPSMKPMPTCDCDMDGRALPFIHGVGALQLAHERTGSALFDCCYCSAFRAALSDCNMDGRALPSVHGGEALQLALEQTGSALYDCGYCSAFKAATCDCDSIATVCGAFMAAICDCDMDGRALPLSMKQRHYNLPENEQRGDQRCKCRRGRELKTLLDGQAFSSDISSIIEVLAFVTHLDTCYSY